MLQATAIVLAGGRSRRMGRDKAHLPLGDGTLLERLLGQVVPVFAEVLLSVDHAQRYPEIDLPQIVDSEPGAGPLAALASTLAQATYPRAFVVACDIPELPASLVQFLLEGLDQPAADGLLPEAVIPTVGRRPQYLLAAYRPIIAPRLHDAVGRGKRAAACVVDLSRARLIPLSQLPVNLNTPEQYRRYLQKTNRS